jgi:hypothetical protein
MLSFSLDYDHAAYAAYAAYAADDFDRGLQAPGPCHTLR